MQFTFHKDSGIKSLIIEDESYKYLIKARRHKIDDEIYFRNLKDNFIFLYKIVSINKKSATLNLLSSEEKIVKNKKKLHLAWCIVEAKTVEKNLASLNELGVDELSFIYCDFSQKNFKLNFEKLQKILINSSSQCGRSDIIKLNLYKNLNEFLNIYPNSYFLDFSTNTIENKKQQINTLIVGCEGGFSKKERTSFSSNNIVGFDSSLILKSETAIIAASSKILI